MKVEADDSDLGTNGQVDYSVDSDLFSINSVTGELSAQRPLDFESDRSHNLLVQVSSPTLSFPLSLSASLSASFSLSLFLPLSLSLPPSLLPSLPPSLPLSLHYLRHVIEVQRPAVQLLV